MPWQVNQWHAYDLEPEKKLADFDALDELDVWITHLAILQNYPDLLDWVNLHYEVSAAFYDQGTYGDIGPILVMERLRGGPDARRLYALERGSDAEAYRARRHLDEQAEFERASPGPGGRPQIERARLLGCEYEVLPPQELGWITYHWTSATGLAHDYVVVDRLTAPDERNAWDNNHSPAYGRHPTSAWEPGAILREGYLVVAAAEPFLSGGPYRPIGGGYRRGDLIPVRLWMKLVEYDPASIGTAPPVELGRLQLVHPSTGALVRPPDAAGEEITPDGLVFSPDDLAVVGKFWMPVQPRARLPDDGRPIP